MLKTLLPGLLIGLLTSTTALAQTDNLPGTDITRPQADIVCDKADDTKDYNSERVFCTKAAEQYKVIIGKLADYKNLPDKDWYIQEMRYNETYCLFQIAAAYKGLGNDVQGHNYAVEAFNNYDISRMYYWGKLNAAAGRKFDDTTPIDYQAQSKEVQEKLNTALTHNEVWLMGNFTRLMNAVNELYPGATQTDNT